MWASSQTLLRPSKCYSTQTLLTNFYNVRICASINEIDDTYFNGQFQHGNANYGT